MNNTPKKSGKIKPFLLSLVLFPGLGQLVQGKKFLGLSIMMVISVCLYVVFTEAFSQIHEAAQRMAAEGSVDAFRAQQEAHNIIANLNTPKFLTAFYTLLLVWIFSAVEVFRTPEK